MGLSPTPRGDKGAESRVATGLAVTGAGGDVLFIEATAMEGDAGLTLTGQLGDVMKESVSIALSYLRSRGLAGDLASKKLHVHVPAGAVPKDGPSAGVARIVYAAPREAVPDLGYPASRDTSRHMAAMQDALRAVAPDQVVHVATDGTEAPFRRFLDGSNSR